MIEVEDKFRVHADFELPVVNANGGPVAVVSPPRTSTLTAVYFDTEDLRLARAGITMRHRAEDGKSGWQLKLPVSGLRAGVREELHEDGPPGTPPQRLRDLVTAYVRTAELAERAMLRTERTTYDLYGADGALLVEMVDDRVDALTADHHAARFREIEVEDRGGGSGVLDHVGGLLREAGAVAGEFEPKVVRALGPRATAPPEPPRPEAATNRDPARVLVAAVLREHVRALIGHDPWVRLGTDDAVHQMRVSARRLRSALRDLAPLMDQAWAEQVTVELRWLGEALSGSRDTEVIEGRLLDALDRLDPRVRSGRPQTILGGMLAAQAADGAGAAEAALGSDRYRALIENLIDAATHPRTTDLANRPAVEVLPELVTASWRRLAKRARAACAEGATPEEFHRTRIAAKRMRYLSESLVSIYGKPAKSFARKVEQLQIILGLHQDAVLAGAVLRRAAEQPRVGRAAFTFGVMHANEDAAAQRERERFRELWPDVARRRRRRWFAG
jgi:CHAD domain-containing protein